MNNDAIYEPDRNSPILSQWLQFRDGKNLYSPVLIRVRRRHFDSELIRALDWKQHGHSHHIYHLIYFLSGQNYILVNEKRCEVTGGKVILINPGEFHNIIPQEPSDCSYITLMFAYQCRDMVLRKPFHELISGLCGKDVTAEEIVADRDGRLRYYFAYLERTILEGTNRSTSPVEYALLGLFNELCDKWHSKTNHLPPEEILAVKNYLVENLEHNVQLRDLQDVAKLSRSHLLDKFKRTYGVSPIEFLIHLRIDRAKMYLSHSRKRIKEISTLCGFNSEYYFCRIFKQNTSMTPGQYRQESLYKD